MRLDQLNEIDEFRLRAYERAALYKEKMKLHHERRIEKREFQVGDLEILFNSRFKLFLSKLKSKWSGTFKVTQVFPSGLVELENKKGKLFKVNDKRVEQYAGLQEEVKLVTLVYLDEV